MFTIFQLAARAHLQQLGTWAKSTPHHTTCACLEQCWAHWLSYLQAAVSWPEKCAGQAGRNLILWFWSEPVTEPELRARKW